MVDVTAKVIDEFGPSPMDRSVLRFLKEHRASTVWEGEVK